MFRTCASKLCLSYLCIRLNVFRICDLCIQLTYWCTSDVSYLCIRPTYQSMSDVSYLCIRPTYQSTSDVSYLCIRPTYQSTSHVSYQCIRPTYQRTSDISICASDSRTGARLVFRICASDSRTGARLIFLYVRPTHVPEHVWYFYLCVRLTYRSTSDVPHSAVNQVPLGHNYSTSMQWQNNYVLQNHSC